MLTHKKYSNEKLIFIPITQVLTLEQHLWNIWQNTKWLINTCCERTDEWKHFFYDAKGITPEKKLASKREDCRLLRKCWPATENVRLETLLWTIFTINIDCRSFWRTCTKETQPKIMRKTFFNTRFIFLGYHNRHKRAKHEFFPHGISGQ